MKKIIYSAVIVMAFMSVSVANTKEKRTISVQPALTSKTIKTIVSKETQTVVAYTDFAGFVCWLMSRHCQPVESK